MLLIDFFISKFKIKLIKTILKISKWDFLGTCSMIDHITFQSNFTYLFRYKILWLFKDISLKIINFLNKILRTN